MVSVKKSDLRRLVGILAEEIDCLAPGSGFDRGGTSRIKALCEKVPQKGRLALKVRLEIGPFKIRHVRLERVRKSPFYGASPRSRVSGFSRQPWTGACKSEDHGGGWRKAAVAADSATLHRLPVRQGRP
jgi:hypothetical protein